MLFYDRWNLRLHNSITAIRLRGILAFEFCQKSKIIIEKKAEVSEFPKEVEELMVKEAWV